MVVSIRSLASWMPPTPILLFRNAQGDTDPYNTSLTNERYSAHSIAVLETLTQRLTLAIDPQQYSSVIITSARGASAIHSSALPSDNSVTFYVVGEKTASALPNGGLGLDVRGQQTGNANRLADLILSERDKDDLRKMLYLTGDKNRDNMRETLESAGTTLDILQVYATQSRNSDDIENEILETGVEFDGQKHDCILHVLV